MKEFYFYIHPFDFVPCVDASFQKVAEKASLELERCDPEVVPVIPIFKAIMVDKATRG